MAGLLLEIPTGAFADMVGKRRTLILAFLLAGVGNILMGLSGSFWMFAFALWVLVNGGGAFYSGTMEALVYDSLKSLGEEGRYRKTIGLVNATRLWSMSICAVLGGFAYMIYPGLPMVLNGMVTLIGLIVCFWLIEPVIDTEKYTLSSFFVQNSLGIKRLFGSVYMRKLSWYLIATGGLSVVIYNLLDDLLAVEYGYSPFGISVLFAIACLVAGFASMYIPRLKLKLNERSVLIISMVIMAFVLILSPIIGMLVSGVFLMLRVIMEVLYDNASSVAINRNTESNVRATTLSSLSLLRSLPYAIGGAFIGTAIQFVGGARNFSMWFGLALMVVTVILGMRIERNNPRNA
ncbi:MAG: Arabinose efflux permease family protein [Candidatus Collierbacteria bacterium GW2011_GWD2_45_10]|nr:MAG: Arabinose efflux permease family protein [Candidatus Collierbacteria bacterium GW2011_GWA2_44_13]KKT62635.1 MAG: Arabinose efflux permease family protein [Candidatus Collierbacteria bacterium GW2011_GWD1_44_27]KKT89681.1 MAG: Arabinose efflux permease family protein [Candidatus Collierbacteria bacterium GW2011_GWD2_45_10]